jgi:hypothetical protein
MTRRNWKGFGAVPPRGDLRRNAAGRDQEDEMKLLMSIFKASSEITEGSCECSLQDDSEDEIIFRQSCFQLVFKSP